MLDLALLRQILFSTVLSAIALVIPYTVFKEDRECTHGLPSVRLTGLGFVH